MFMGIDESCQGSQVGEDFEFVTNSESCRVAPTIRESKLVFASSIFGKSGMENGVINRFRYMVGLLIKIEDWSH